MSSSLPSSLPPSRKIRVAVSSRLNPDLLRHFPPGVELVRFSGEEDHLEPVDLLVMPNFSPTAKAVLPPVEARYLQTLSAGVENAQKLLPRGAVLLNARGVHDSSTAEWVLGAILASLKWLPLYGALQAEGRWSTPSDGEAHWAGVYGAPLNGDTPVLVEELAGKNVLLVGYGAIGKAIEARLRPFEPGRILRAARTAREGVHSIAELDALLPQADIVVLILPMTEETRRLIGAAQIGRMRQGALLVNAARGGVVDTDALVEALTARRIRAALDVTDPEPLPAGHPLWKAPNLLLTPHVAGSLPHVLDRVFRFIGSQAQCLLAGEEPENIIRGAY